MNANKFVKKYTMVLALLVVFVFFTYLTGGRLLLAQNISNLLLQNAYVLIMACGMLLCILTGGNVDLSIGSTLCLSAALSAKLLSMGISPFVAILASIAVACVIGVWQGWLIGYILDSKTVPIMDKKFLSLFTSYIQIPGLDVNQRVISSMVVGIIVAAAITAYTFMAERKKVKKGYETAGFGLTAARVCIFDLVILFYAYKLMSYKGIPIMLIWILVVVAIFAFVTSSTVFGRYFYAVGGNEKATRLSGIDPRRVYFWAYFLMSILAGLSGLLVVARIGSVDGNMGSSYEMDAIASCFIGGASAYGGSGTVQGIMIGAILLGVINQGMSILGLPDQYQYIVKGAVLLGAVVFDVVSNHKTGKS